MKTEIERLEWELHLARLYCCVVVDHINTIMDNGGPFRSRFDLDLYLNAIKQGAIITINDIDSMKKL